MNVNLELKKVFENKPLLAFRKNKNLRQMIRGNTIEKNKKLLTTNKFTNGKCSPCFSSSRTLCCNQVIKTDHSKSNEANRTFRIFQKTTCKSNFIIYLLECDLCKILYVRKVYVINPVCYIYIYMYIYNRNRINYYLHHSEFHVSTIFKYNIDVIKNILIYKNLIDDSLNFSSITSLREWNN